MTFTANNGCTFCGSDAHMTSVCPMRKAAINIGALDPQQRLDVARGQPAPSVAGMDGWRLVPLQPTEAMMIAGNNAGFWCGDAYRAMLSAAPVPPVQDAPPCWWINHGSHGQITQREDEAQAAADEGKQVFRYAATPQPPAQVDEREAASAASPWAIGSHRSMAFVEGFQVGAAWQRTQTSPAPSADGGKVESAGALHALQVDALNHIIRTCQGSRTSTRRLRWIEQRAKYALDGKPYSDDAFDLPKDATGSNEKLRDEVRRLREALEYALPYLEACVPNPRNGMNADGSVDVNCVDRARAALSAHRGEGERG